MSIKGITIPPAKNPNIHETNISLSHHTAIFLKYASEAGWFVFSVKKFLLIVLTYAPFLW